MNTERSFHTIQNIFWAFAVNALSTIMGFIVKSLIIKYFAAEYLGLNSLLVSLAGALNIAELGFDSVFLYCLYKPFADNDIETVNAILKLYKKIYFVIGIIILFAGLIVSFFLKKIASSNIPSGINIYILFYFYLAQSVVGYLFFAYRRCILFVSQNSAILDKITIINFLINYSVQIVSLKVFHNFYTFAAILPVTYFLNGLVVYFVTRRKYPSIKCEGKLSDDFIKDFISKVYALCFVKIRTASRNYVDTIILSSTLGLVATANYNVYVSVYLVPVLINLIVIGGVKNSIGNYFTQDNIQNKVNLFEEFSFIVFWICSFTSICYLCLIQDFVNIWLGMEMQQPLILPISLSLLCYVQGISLISETIKEITGTQCYNKYTPIIEIIANITLDLIMIRLLGISGVVLATALCIGLITLPSDSFVIYNYYFNRKVTPYLLQLVFNTVTAAIVAFVSYLIISNINFNNLFLIFAIKIICCLIIPNLFLLLFFFRTKNFKFAKQEILAMFKKQ